MAEQACLHRLTDGPRVIGFIGIDTSVAGRARGGLRIAGELSEEEIRLAARAMTLKYGVLGLPQGGAKAGIIGDPDAPAGERRRRLHEFARAAEPWLRTGAYTPDADLGTSAADIRRMMASIGVRVGGRDWRENRSGLHTARSVLASLRAALACCGRSIAECRAAVEGFGKVGSSLARLLHEQGARVVAVSTSRGAVYDPDGLDVPRLLARAAEAGSGFVEQEEGRIDREALIELPVDALLPCARLHSIHAGNVDRVAAKIVCAGANNPVTAEAERRLFARGVRCPPDFVTNCGGVLGGTLEFAGVRVERIGRMIDDFVGECIRDLLQRAEGAGLSPRELAESEALARHDAIRRQAEDAGVLQRLISLGLSAYRRGWVPQPFVSRAAELYMARRFR